MEVRDSEDAGVEVRGAVDAVRVARQRGVGDIAQGVIKMLVEAHGAVARAQTGEFLDARAERVHAVREHERDFVRLRVCDRGLQEEVEQVAAGGCHGAVDALVKRPRKVRGEAREAVAI